MLQDSPHLTVFTEGSLKFGWDDNSDPVTYLNFSKASGLLPQSVLLRNCTQLTSRYYIDCRLIHCLALDVTLGWESLKKELGLGPALPNIKSLLLQDV